MNLPRTPIARISIVLVTLLAWFAISNHCALATVQQEAATIHSSCHGEQPKGPANSSDEAAPCCKTLRATVVDAAKVMPALVSIVPPPADLLLLFTICPPPLLVGYFADTGPPRPSFAEMVLQESVLAHAPPLLA